MDRPILATLLSDSTKKSLTSAIRGARPKSTFKILKTLDQVGFECLYGDEKVGTVIIEHGFPLEELALSMERLRGYGEKKPEKIILLMAEDDMAEELVTNYLSLGFSGILTKPFSEGSVSEVLEVSERLSMMGSIARLKVATSIQIKSMLEKSGQKFEASSVLKSVKRACESFEKNNPGQKIKDIAEEFAKLEPKDRIGNNLKDIYKGASERVKKLIEKRN